MYYINTVFLQFRLRQLGKIVREIPVPYLIILAVMLLFALFALYHLTGGREEMAMAGGGVIVLLFLFHRVRKDYHFLQLVDEYPARIFCADYLLLSLPVFVVGVLHGFYLVAAGVSVGCMAVGFIRQPVRRIGNGCKPPRFIPGEAFEVRAGIRSEGGILFVLYTAAYIGLWLPYLSLGVLWLFSVILLECFNYAEPAHLLCVRELSAKRFLHYKLGLNVRLYGAAIAPVCLLYAIVYPEGWWLALGFFVYSTINMALVIVSKYAFYLPNTKITAGQVAITLSILGVLIPVLFPLTLFFLIKNYVAARRNLISYLYAYN